LPYTFQLQSYQSDQSHLAMSFTLDIAAASPGSSLMKLNVGRFSICGREGFHHGAVIAASPMLWKSSLVIWYPIRGLSIFILSRNIHNSSMHRLQHPIAVVSRFHCFTKHLRFVDPNCAPHRPTRPLQKLAVTDTAETLA
jgi:hypothetical protein